MRRNIMTSVLPLMALAGVLPIPEVGDEELHLRKDPLRDDREDPPRNNTPRRIAQEQADHAAFYRAERARKKAEQFEKQHKGKSQKT